MGSERVSFVPGSIRGVRFLSRLLWLSFPSPVGLHAIQHPGRRICAVEGCAG